MTVPHLLLQIDLVADDVEYDHGHAVLGEGAGLVGADDGDRAQGLHGRQLADERLAAQHPLRAQREGHGDDGGQALGDGGHGHADGRQEHHPHFFAPKQPLRRR